jgi:hypothetical protein
MRLSRRAVCCAVARLHRVQRRAARLIRMLLRRIRNRVATLRDILACAGDRIAGREHRRAGEQQECDESSSHGFSPYQVRAGTRTDASRCMQERVGRFALAGLCRCGIRPCPACARCCRPGHHAREPIRSDSMVRDARPCCCQSRHEFHVGAILRSQAPITRWRDASGAQVHQPSSRLACPAGVSVRAASCVALTFATGSTTRISVPRRSPRRMSKRPPRAATR